MCFVQNCAFSTDENGIQRIWYPCHQRNAEGAAGVHRRPRHNAHRQSKSSSGHEKRTVKARRRPAIRREFEAAVGNWGVDAVRDLQRNRGSLAGGRKHRLVRPHGACAGASGDPKRPVGWVSPCEENRSCQWLVGRRGVSRDEWG